MSPTVIMPRYEKFIEGMHVHYELLDEIPWHSVRYNKDLTCKIGMPSDGATFAPDLASRAWWIHDLACRRRTWDDGTPITSWQSGMIIKDALREEGRYIRAPLWGFGTYLFQRIIKRWK